MQTVQLVVGVGLFCAVLVPVQAEQPSPRQAALTDLARDIVEQYPDIPHVDVHALQDRLAGVTLIDVREPAEFAVSRIPGAININDADTLLAFARTHDKPLVLYCSVGRRSADFTELLHRAGEAQAVNFVGSIFAWGNQGMALEDDQGTTDAVHPYNWFWGWRYLDAQLHASKPR
ncbi:MAG: rhodanese-like domain-containing protein [Pseudomonadota bacterium]